ncbi:hypothetical protein N7456_004914 [Penicillium angulare]|uniref:NmrA-like domain-containing protein n=1 Tax=Penicillium angulare TaxID=116970 RepID=A0A9W9KIT8_9EURO|nr:hypothetical protein N7456_004914 [Penicillium angulare]
MLVAIAGSGDMARYLTEELSGHGHEVVILSRSIKPYFQDLPGVSQVVIDYSVPSIVQAIQGCKVMISTILDYSMTFVEVHQALIDACKQSDSCKRFVPSEFGGNLETHPEQPGFYFRTREPVRNMLRVQSELEWTLVSVGWLVDYLVPAKNRYLKDIGPAFPIDLADRKIIIPGTGKEPINVTCARDLAKALVRLLEIQKWETYTYISGEQTTWNDVANLVIEKYSGFSVSHIGRAEIQKDIAEGGDQGIIAEYQLFSLIGASSFDQAKVKNQEEKYFKGLHFRSPREIIEAVESDDQIVV